MRKGYILPFEAHYKDQMKGREFVDEISVLVGSEIGRGVDYEFSIKWYKILNEACPRIELFHDSWKAFEDLAPFFRELSWVHPRHAVVRDLVISILQKHGFKDETER